MLEVIDRGRCTSEHPTPLLFVHGAWHAAWCWDEHFLNFFAEKGYYALAVSLRGHGGSPTTKPLRACSIADYVDDVGSVAEKLSMTPVVIGHSMGGLVAQKYLESNDAPAAVLLASVPPRGASGAMLRLMKRHPWLCLKTVTGTSLRLVDTSTLAREVLFSPSTPALLVDRYVARFEEESIRAMSVDMIALSRARPKQVNTPLLVLGAENDGSINANEIRATARAYDTEAGIFPDMGHDMMLEPGWAMVAERIHAWLANRDM